MTVLSRYKPLLWPLAIALLAAIAYVLRISDEMVDFNVYRTAALRALDAEPLYRAEDGHYQFKYLPVFAFGMAPFAVLSADVARMAWFGGSVGLLMSFLRWSILGLPERRRSMTALTWLAVLFMAKFYLHELTLGQSNLLLGTLLVGALLSVQVEQPKLAGTLIALAAFVKPYALVLLPWLLATCGLGAGLGAAIVLAAGLLLPAAVYGWGGNLDLLAAWYQTVTASTAPNLLGADNISFAAMWAKWLAPGPLATGLATATSGAALGFAAVVWLRRRATAEPDFLEFALLMLLVPLLSPQGWDYVLLLATPAVICLIDRWSDVHPAWKVFTAAALAMMGLTLFDVMGRALYGAFMALSLVSVAALGLLAALANLRRQGLA